jgi:hypothetical protein
MIGGGIEIKFRRESLQVSLALSSTSRLEIGKEEGRVQKVLDLHLASQRTATARRQSEPS